MLEFCNSRWVWLGVAMDKSAPRKEIVISYLKNWYQYTESLAFVGLTFANLVVNRDSLPIDVQFFLILEIIAGFSLAGIYMFSSPYKYKNYMLMMRIDEICDQRKTEFTNDIYSRTEKLVYFLHKVVLPLDSIFFLITYITMSLAFWIYYVYCSEEELDYEKLFRAVYLL